jgi:biotin carboxyl carrier protein
VPDTPPPSPRRSGRSAADRAADHAAIDRLGAELLPALIAKLGATGLGELEVREGAWKVRLRRPASSGSGRDRKAGERGSGAAERVSPDRADRHADRAAKTAHHHPDGASPRAESQEVATSPAVGIYRPRTDLTVGDRVRSGDRLGAVDMLGIAQEVLAPVDGVVGASLAQSGDAVEYGQDLVVIEMAVATIAPTNVTGG